MSKQRRKVPQKQNKSLIEIKANINIIKEETMIELNQIGVTILSLANKYDNLIQENQELKTSMHVLSDDYKKYGEGINSTITKLTKLSSKIASKTAKEILPKILNNATKLTTELDEAKSVLTKDIDLIEETVQKYNINKTEIKESI